MSKKIRLIEVEVIAPHARTGKLGQIRLLDENIANRWVAAGLVKKVEPKTKPKGN